MRKTTIAASFVAIIIIILTLNLDAQTCQVCRTEYGGGGRWRTNISYCAPADYGEPGYTSCEAHNAPVGPSRCFLYDAACVGEPGPPFFGTARSYQPVQIASLDGEMAAAYVQPDAGKPSGRTELAENARFGYEPPDIRKITANFDKLVAELGEAETKSGVQAANGMTDDEINTLLKWMDGVRQAVRAEKQAARAPESEKVRKHHVTCSRALRPCWRQFEKEQQ